MRDLVDGMTIKNLSSAKGWQVLTGRCYMLQLYIKIYISFILFCGRHIFSYITMSLIMLGAFISKRGKKIE